ncbi:signal peptidase I [Candidatus Palibaumannia cicadellinicola]|uniref:Signal peptidase I n=1 Tax=Candidatus Palibaumannia cicadellinicola TaxID=186490 RepID=A0A0K2BK86_9GAMM|nr:signal peptidase I [Candidatus Baumannia cicadellinicola]AKZ65831.1 Signal peptidase I [Candidatus Baumannia cicadellinicola]
MAYRFIIILAILTVITGIAWLLKHVKRKLAHLNNSSIVAVVEKNNHDLLSKIASAFPVLLLVFIVRSFVVEPFHIPSGSMMPTLCAGDFILVKKFSYGIKNPINQNTIINTGHPKRGDVVVFKYPLDPSQDYIKRVIGLPGDKISYDPILKRIMIQPNWNKIASYTKNSSLSITYSDITLSNFVQHLTINNNGYASNEFMRIPKNQLSYNGIRLSQCKESLGGVIHDILIVPSKLDYMSIYYQQPGYSIKEWIVPQGEYFMMGDNRDNSADSRYWGFVPYNNIVGKAIFIWMSVDTLKNKWPTGVCLSRIGYIN